MPCPGGSRLLVTDQSAAIWRTKCARSEPSAWSSFQPWRSPRASDGRPPRSRPTRSDSSGLSSPATIGAIRGGARTTSSSPAPAATPTSEPTAEPRDDKGGQGEVEPGDDKGGANQAEPGDDKGGASEAQPADDKGGANEAQPADDKGGLSGGGHGSDDGATAPAAKPTAKATAEPGDDNGGSTHAEPGDDNGGSHWRPRLGRLDQIQQEAERRSFGVGVSAFARFTGCPRRPDILTRCPRPTSPPSLDPRHGRLRPLDGSAHPGTSPS